MNNYEVTVKFFGDVRQFMLLDLDLLDEDDLQKRKNLQLTTAHTDYLVKYFVNELANWALDMDEYTGVDIFVCQENYIDEIVFFSPKYLEINITNIWFDREKCEVLQYGSQHGRLTL